MIGNKVIFQNKIFMFHLRSKLITVSDSFPVLSDNVDWKIGCSSQKRQYFKQKISVPLV